MPNDLQCLFHRDIATFMERLTAENYKPQTIKAYRVLLKRLVSLIEAAGISPQDLTAERAAELVRNRCPNSCIGEQHIPAWQAAIADAERHMQNKRLSRAQRPITRKDRDRMRGLIAPLMAGAS